MVLGTGPSTTTGIPIGNADIRQQIAQDIGTPTVTVPNLVQNPVHQGQV